MFGVEACSTSPLSQIPQYAGEKYEPLEIFGRKKEITELKNTNGRSQLLCNFSTISIGLIQSQAKFLSFFKHLRNKQITINSSRNRKKNAWIPVHLV